MVLLNYLPIYEVAKSLQPFQIRLLPFLYSLNGRGTTSHSYFPAKSTACSINQSQHTTEEAFGENGQCEITKDLMNITKNLMNAAQDIPIATYAKYIIVP